MIPLNLSQNRQIHLYPGFPVGDAELIGGANSRYSAVSKKLFVKTKESGPLGRVCAGGPPMWSAVADPGFPVEGASPIGVVSMW